MTLMFRKERVPRIDNEQWARLSAYFATPRSEMVYAIGNAAGISYVLANALVLAMATDGVATLWWAVFHRCEEHPVASRAYAEGVILEPLQCPECEAVISSPSAELKYSLECRTSEAVTFE